MESPFNNQLTENSEQEVSLVFYINLIWLYRKTIIVITLIIVSLTILVSFLLPKTYQSSALISPAKISNEIVEDQSAVVDILKQETTLRELTKQFGWPESDYSKLAQKFTINQINNFWQIKSLGESPEEAKGIAYIIANFVVNHQNNIAARFKPDLEAEVNLLQDELDKNATNIANVEEKISALKNPNSTAQGLIAASYISARQNAKFRRDELQKELYDKQRELNFHTRESKIEVPPVLALEPIKPNKKLNVIISIILGFAASFCYVLILNYLEKNKKTV